MVAFDKRVPLVNAFRSRETSANIAISHISLNTRFFGLHLCRRQQGFIYNYFDVIALKSHH